MKARMYRLLLTHARRSWWLALCAAHAGAQDASVTSITTQGATGGLVIPSAHVLPGGSLALTMGNYQEPQLGTFDTRRNFSLGLGLLPNIELFGRFAEYQNPSTNPPFLNGPRDLSANVKFKLPAFWRGQPDLAVGLNDLGGGAAAFKSRYVVASHDWGPARLSAGYAWGSPAFANTAGRKTFDGAFGGVQVRLGDTGLSALAEHDGQQRHVGVRYTSQPLPALGHAQVVGTLQRSGGAVDLAGRDADRTTFALSVLVPLGGNEARRGHFQIEHRLASLDPPAAPAAAMVPTTQDRQQSLLNALAAAGLERVRVGMQGNTLLVEYENHRYGQNEADALGVVLGLAAELAPAGTRRVAAITLKAGMRSYETSVDVAQWRAYLRDGDASYAQTSLTVDRAPAAMPDVQWLDARPSRRVPVRLEISPDVVYALGTEVGAFDYSLAANLQAIVPLWRGAELYTSYIRRLDNSSNYAPGLAFGAYRHRNGLKVAAVHQSFWLGPQVFANIGVGRYAYDAWGVQGEVSVFVPGRDDVVRLRGGAYGRQPGQSRRQAVPVSATYRWVPASYTWVEAGLQQYSDGSRGPSVVLTRWFGDVGAHLYYRKGGSVQYAGLELSIPLTPRQGMAAGPVELGGAAQFQRGVRTRVTDSGTAANVADPAAVRDMQLDYNAELRQLNAGRASERYFISQLPRMREAFYRYGRSQLP